MDAEVFLTYSSVSEDDVRNRTVVVIDVLRACSTITTALHNGARAVMPVQDMAEAGKIASNLDPDVYRLGGERDGEKIDGYHLGNSPPDYTENEVENRDVILNTTNGTQALSRAKSAKHLVAACFLNAGRVVDFVRAVDDEVTIVCAGQQNRLALEDTLCAGLLLDRLWEDDEPDVVTDSAHTAYTLYHTDRDHLSSALRRANHAEWLIQKGFGDDLDYCFRIDPLPILPYYTENRLVRYEQASAS
ncbi:2-phosphosulfolactate phosphatase [Salinibacter sp. 10B]|uniref:2-phosphosulfolactate phosphatase n=1 Tax=Salinibacter sp. 10B TaxID=1923971 RepID=UPI000CF51554|nr:2-phosphosulfolactate phosphatase [Salinibacter sp. 10B]PQJ35798.1 2-phosphosulfolactate phosphatase [Salinibacter sp. 10B]